MSRSVINLALVGMIVGGVLVAGAKHDPESGKVSISESDTSLVRGVPSQIYCGQVERMEQGSFALIHSSSDTVFQRVTRVHFSDKTEKILHGTDLQKIHLGSKYSIRLWPQKDGTYHMTRLMDGNDCQ